MIGVNLQNVMDVAKKGAASVGVGAAGLVGNFSGAAAGALAALDTFPKGSLKDIIAPDFNTAAAAIKGAAGGMSKAAEKITAAMPGITAKLDSVTKSLSGAGFSESMTKQLNTQMMSAQKNLGAVAAGSQGAVDKIAASLPKNFTIGGMESAKKAITGAAETLKVDAAAAVTASGVSASSLVESAKANLGEVTGKLTGAMGDLSAMKDTIARHLAGEPCTGAQLVALKDIQQKLTGVLQNAEGMAQSVVAALPPLPALPFAIPSAGSIASLIPKLPTLPCGINIKLDALEGIQQKLDDVMGELTSTVNGVFDQINSLKSQMESTLNECVTKLKDALGEIKIPTLEFPAELLKALSLMQSDATAFMAALAKLKIDFPSIDIDSILNKMVSGLDFNFCKLVPNVKIIDGKEVTKAEPSTTAVGTPEPVTVQATQSPETKPPSLETRLGTITEKDKSELDGILSSPGLAEALAPLDSVRSASSADVNRQITVGAANAGIDLARSQISDWEDKIWSKITKDIQKYYKLGKSNGKGGWDGDQIPGVGGAAGSGFWQPIDPTTHKFQQIVEEKNLKEALVNGAYAKINRIIASEKDARAALSYGT